MLAAARLRHILGTRWGAKRYMSMTRLDEMEVETLKATAYFDNFRQPHEAGRVILFIFALRTVSVLQRSFFPRQLYFSLWSVTGEITNSGGQSAGHRIAVRPFFKSRRIVLPTTTSYPMGTWERTLTFSISISVMSVHGWPASDHRTPLPLLICLHDKGTDEEHLVLYKELCRHLRLSRDVSREAQLRVGDHHMTVACMPVLAAGYLFNRFNLSCDPLKAILASRLAATFQTQYAVKVIGFEYFKALNNIVGVGAGAYIDIA